MNTKLFIYMAIVVAEIICGYVGFREGVYVLKPLIMLSLIYWNLDYLKTHRWLWIGMWFGLGGDVCLMFSGNHMFMAGLGSFLVMQLFYITAFTKQKMAKRKQELTGTTWKLTAPFALYGLSFLAILYPSMMSNAATKGLWIPVVAYSICLCSMGAAAALRKYSVKQASYVWVLAGAVLFILSDSTIALNKFMQPFDASLLLVMTTYGAAQWLIVWGVRK